MPSDAEKANPYPLNTVAGRAWWKGYNEGLRQQAQQQIGVDLAALSRRPAGEVGKLVERLRDVADIVMEACEYDDMLDVQQRLVEIADALTALSSAPVDAGVEELAKVADDWIGYLKRRRLHGSAAFVEKLLATLRTLSRQLATERQALEKVRAELAGADIAALPDDYSTVQMASDRMAENDDLRAASVAGRDLVNIVEGVQGAMEHGTFRGDQSGKRLKDTPEWVGFYNALAIRAAERDTGSP